MQEICLTFINNYKSKGKSYTNYILICLLFFFATIFMCKQNLVGWEMRLIYCIFLENWKFINPLNNRGVWVGFRESNFSTFRYIFMLNVLHLYKITNKNILLILQVFNTTREKFFLIGFSRKLEPNYYYICIDNLYLFLNLYIKTE